MIDMRPPILVSIGFLVFVVKGLLGNIGFGDLSSIVDPAREVSAKPRRASPKIPES